MALARRTAAALALTAATLMATLVAVPAALAQDGAAPGAAPSASRGTPWTPLTVEKAAALPVQEGGRVKPLSTQAAFALLRANGTRVYRTAAGEKLSPTHWLLDVVFRPGDAAKEEFFLVEEDAVLDAIGMKHEGRKRRDRYAYDALAPHRRELFRLATDYQKVEAKSRTPVQAQVLRLAMNINEFETLASFAVLSGIRVPVGKHPDLAAVFEGRAEVGPAEFLRRFEVLQAAALASKDGGGGPQGPAARALDEIVQAFERTAHSGGGGIAMFPPSAAEDPDHPERGAWMTPEELIHAALIDRVPHLESQLDLLQGVELLLVASDDPVAFEKVMVEVHDRAVRQAEARGEYSKIPMEVSYYRADWFYRALLCFMAGCLLMGLHWLLPNARWVSRLLPLPVVVGLILVTAGITVRCIIRGRPPVSTLYETIIFITGVSVAVALVAEWIHRRHVAVSAAAVFGAVGMFLSGKFETHEAVDTMPQLVAVLDTNFWLATHVTIINIGYAAGLFSGLVAHWWILGGILGIRSADTTYWKSIIRMVYGLLACSLVFSLVGTILGGIWANDSWGRFWGWDPKENGALMICLWQLIVLHARMGGYIRDRGVALCAVFGGMIVAFSWWGVNLLGVGLHSYGFTSGAMFGLMVFYGIETIVLLVGGIHGLVQTRTPAVRGASQ